MTLNSQDHGSAVNELLTQAYVGRVSDLNNSIALARQALGMSRMQNDMELIAKCLTHLALFKMIKGDYELSKKCSAEAMHLYRQLEDEKGIADVRYNLAGIHYKTNDFHLGMLELLECHETYIKFEDHHSCSKVEKSLGTIYEYFGDTINAMKSYELGIESAKKAGDLNLESNCYNPLSGILIKENKVDEAFEIIEKSIDYKTRTGDERGLAFSYYARGKAFAHCKNYDSAERDFMSALEIHEAKGERLGMGMTYNKLGKLYTCLGDLNKAKEVLFAGIAFCEKYSISLFYSKCCQQLSDIFKQENNYERAFFYLNLYQKEKESMLDAQMKRVIDNYEAISKMKTMEIEAKSQKEKAEITEKKNRAEEAARIKSEFLSTMSHEIRTPLNAVISISNMLKDSPNAEDQKLIESLRFSGNNLMRIVNDILDFTKLEAGKMKLELHSTDFISCLQKIGNTYSTLAENKKIDLIVLVDEKINGCYEMDETRLCQVIGNLLSNAIKFTDFGEVKLSAQILNQREKSDIIRFSIEDTGEGISQKHLEDIFETFAQPRSVATRKQGGTGLGLAVVKRIVQLLGSDIKVKSEIGVGSIFQFDLELKKSKKIEIPEPRETNTLIGKSVLLAEDNAINTIVATKILSDWGMHVDHAANGQYAVIKANQKKYDYILMDIHMPEMSGYEATQLIRDNDGLNQRCKIFALTADISADQDSEFTGKFDAFLTKPINIHLLQNALLS